MGELQIKTMPIEPLRKVSLEGEIYTRVPEVTAELDKLLRLSLAEQATLCEITDEKDANFVRSECLVHLVRSLRDMPESREFQRLYAALLKRVAQRLPRAEKGKAVKMKEQDIQDVVLGKCIEFLATDRASYDGRLDFFEVRFESALRRLLDTAFKTEGRRTKRQKPLEYEEGDIPEEVETAAREAAESEFPAFNLSEDCRFKLEVAIDSLPQEEQTVIQMIRKGFPYTSADASKPSITQALGKKERMVRYIKTNAIEKLKTAMSEGGCL